jgi:hypothetical protein
MLQDTCSLDNMCCAAALAAATAQVMLRVGDLQRSIDYFTNVMGMKLLRTRCVCVGGGGRSSRGVCIASEEASNTRAA